MASAHHAFVVVVVVVWTIMTIDGGGGDDSCAVLLLLILISPPYVRFYCFLGSNRHRSFSYLFCIFVLFFYTWCCDLTHALIGHAYLCSVLDAYICGLHTLRPTLTELS